MTRAALVLGAGLLALPVMIAVLVAGLLTATTSGLSAASPAALADIPPNYLLLYRQAAADCPGLDWTLLAAIGKVESDHGRSHAPGVTNGQNPAGAGVISGSAQVSRHVRLVGDTPRASEVSAGCES